MVLEVLLPRVKLSMVKVFRVIRVGKILRAARFAKAFNGLQKIFTAMRTCLSNLFWVFLTMFLIMYFCGIIMINGVTDFVQALALARGDGESRRLGVFDTEEGAAHIDVLNHFYGSFARVCLTLFRAITGDNWAVFAEPLTKVGAYLGGLWIVYVGCMLFGLLNIATGVFVDSAMKCADSDHVIAMMEQKQKERDLKQLLRNLFVELGKDRTDRLTEDEFDMLMRHEEVLSFLQAVGIQHEFAKRLFKILDTENSGLLTLDEIVKAFFSVTGGAKAFDMFLQHTDSKRLEKKLNELRKHVDAALVRR
jgi:Ca2+-binding EF-hand superfamily protein